MSKNARVVSRNFKSLEQVDRFRMRLYDKFERVELIASPFFTEAGRYMWRVWGEK